MSDGHGSTQHTPRLLEENLRHHALFLMVQEMAVEHRHPANHRVREVHDDVDRTTDRNADGVEPMWIGDRAVVLHEREKVRLVYVHGMDFPRLVQDFPMLKLTYLHANHMPRETDADLLIDALTGPLYFRRIIGHAPVSEAFASELASRVLQGFRRPVGL
jgi:hypothetical protein